MASRASTAGGGGPTANASSSSSSSARPPRTYVKASTSSSAARRRAMTERRHQLASTIRKAKRGRTVALKRRVVAVSGAGPAGAADVGGGGMFESGRSGGRGADPVELASSFVECVDSGNAPEASERLSALQTALASSSSSSSAGEGAGGGASAAMNSLLAMSHSDETASTITAGAATAPSQQQQQQLAQSPAVRLANALARCLVAPSSSIVGSGADRIRLDAAKVLTNLAAIEAPPTSSGIAGGGEDDDCSYYGRATKRWCDVLLDESDAVSSLLRATDASCAQVSPQQQQASSPSSVGDAAAAAAAAAALCEQCAWAIGNVAGDSQGARDALRSRGAVPILVGALRCGLRTAVTATGRSGAAAGTAASSTGTTATATSTAGLCRNAAWALSNLARGSTTPALPFLDARSVGGPGAGLLTGELLSYLLSSPVSFGDNAAASSAGTLGESATWDDVSRESAWIVAFLTAREDEAIDVLCSFGGGTAVLSRALSDALARAVRIAALGAGAGAGGGAAAEEALRTCVPCVRSVGNVVSSCDGRHVASLLLVPPPSTAVAASDVGMGNGLSNDDSGGVAQSLAALIRAGSKGSNADRSTLASEAAWAASTLLVDAGRTGHPSTSVACPVLVPALCDAVASDGSRLELRREAAAALWNAVVAPPPASPSSADAAAGGGGGRGADAAMAPLPSPSAPMDDDPTLRDQILAEIARTNGIISSLVRTTSLHLDADAAFASIRLLNAILRGPASREPRLRRIFEEADGIDVLEKVCDDASSSAPYGRDKWPDGGGGGLGTVAQSAEIAANLIDDLFGDEALAREEDDGRGGAATMEEGGGGEGPSHQYPFGFATAEGGGANQPLGGFDFSVSGPQGGAFGARATLQQQQQQMGRGRGRGKVVPAWMQKQPG